MEQLNQILHEATTAVGPEYFLLPIHGAGPIHRERVYCYELYHQMRLRWPADTPYVLNGEIDKSGHPYFANDEGKPKPDFVVHVPGGGSNHAVIEVKSSRGSSKEIEKDVRTFCRLAARGYERCIYLIYGAEIMLERIHRSAREIEIAVPIEVWFHPAPAQPAVLAFVLTPQE